MPTRTGLDYHKIHPGWFVCSYCYQAAPHTCVTHFSGMIKKRVIVRIDDEVDSWAVVPDAYTSVYTQPHCFKCNRKVRGYQCRLHYPNRYKYV